MNDYVWDGRRGLLHSRSNAGARKEQVEYQDSYVKCSAGIKRGKMQSMKRGERAFNAWTAGGRIGAWAKHRDIVVRVKRTLQSPLQEKVKKEQTWGMA